MMDEITQITDYIQDEAGLSADIIWGNGKDEELGDNISITLIATGFEANKSIGGIQSAPHK
jgi:cell division protein FtsZ